MTANFTDFLASLQAEAAAEKAEQEFSLEDYEKFAAQRGILAGGQSTPALAETEVLVEGSPVFSCASIGEARERAARISGLEPAVKTFLTRVDGEGIECYLTERKRLGTVAVTVPQVVFTDARGIVIPTAELAVRAFGHVEEDECECAPTSLDFLEKAPVSVRIPGPFERTWVYEAEHTEPAKRFIKLLEAAYARTLAALHQNYPVEKGGHVFAAKVLSREELVANECAADAEKLRQAQVQIQEILDGISECPEREIPLPEGKGYAPPPESPTKKMGMRDWMRSLARSAKRSKARQKANPHADKIAQHEKNIRALQAELRDVRRQLNDIRPSTLVVKPFQKKSVVHLFCETEIARLEEHKRILLDSITCEKDAIANLDGSWANTRERSQSVVAAFSLDENNYSK